MHPARPNCGERLDVASDEDAISVIHALLTLPFFLFTQLRFDSCERHLPPQALPSLFYSNLVRFPFHGARNRPHLPFILPPCQCVLLPSLRSFYQLSLSPRTVASTVPPVARKPPGILVTRRRARSRNATAPAQAHLVGSVLVTSLNSSSIPPTMPCNPTPLIPSTNSLGTV